MKKLFVLLSVILLATSGTVCIFKKANTMPKQEQVNVSTKNAEENVEDNLQSEENTNNEILTVQEEKGVVEAKAEISDVKNNTTTNHSSNENKNNSVSFPKNEKVEETQKPKPNEQNNTQSNKNQNNNTSNNQTQINKVSTTFYDSITGGKKEFSSESEAVKRGNEIQNKELDYVMDYNEAHPDNPIQADINYFRVYPSVIDESGKYWYYLHFFCQSGEGNDEKLKNMY